MRLIASLLLMAAAAGLAPEPAAQPLPAAPAGVARVEDLT
jgi:hypothetical protein